MYQFPNGYVSYPSPPSRRRWLRWKSVLSVSVLIFLFSGASFLLGVKVAPSLGNSPRAGSGSIDGDYLYTDSTTVDVLQVVSATQIVLGSSYNVQMNEQGEYARMVGKSFICNTIGVLHTEPYVANIAGSVLTWGNLTGTFDGRTITFTLPDIHGKLQNEIFKRASIDQYNTALQQFKDRYQGSTSC